MEFSREHYSNNTPEITPLFVAPDLNNESFLTSVTFLGFGVYVETISEKLNIELTKTTELIHH